MWFRKPMPDKLLHVFLCETDRHEGMPLHEAIVDACRRAGMAGATVLRGLEGFGEGVAAIRKHPISILVVDTAEKIDGLVPTLQPMLSNGLIAISEVKMRRITAPQSAP